MSYDPFEVKMMQREKNKTQDMDLVKDTTLEVPEILEQVYAALSEKGYNPVSQIVGYIMSGDPTYITSHKNARSIIMKVERDELVEELLDFYIRGKLEK
jgi:uncharacterized protein (UPF0297 family)